MSADVGPSAASVTVEVTSSALGAGVSGFGRRLTFALSTPVSAVKERLRETVGTAVAFQRLQLRVAEAGTQSADTAKVIAELSDDAAPLGRFVPKHLETDPNLNIHVVDEDPDRTVERFNDVDGEEAAAARFVLSEDAYEARPDTFRAWKRDNPEAYAKWQADLAARRRAEKGLPPRDPDAEVYDTSVAPAGVTVGARCAVAPLVAGSADLADTSGDVEARMRGVVRFVGEVDHAPGFWVGVCLDEPLGKNNGEVNGRRYFDAPDQCGLFVRGNRVTCGDFPERDLFADLEDLDDDDEL